MRQRRLWTLIRQYGVREDAYRAYLKQLHIQSTKDLTIDQLDVCIAEIQARKADAFQTEEPFDLTTGEVLDGHEAHENGQEAVPEAEIVDDPSSPDQGKGMDSGDAQALEIWDAALCGEPGKRGDQRRNILLEIVTGKPASHPEHLIDLNWAELMPIFDHLVKFVQAGNVADAKSQKDLAQRFLAERTAWMMRQVPQAASTAGGEA